MVKLYKCSIFVITEIQFAIPTKLYETCGCNNKTIFQKRATFTFPTVDICREIQPGGAQALVMLHNYRVKYYDYIAKLCSGIACDWWVSLDITSILPLTMYTILPESAPKSGKTMIVYCKLCKYVTQICV